jgi:hypothetical protein
MNKIKAIETRYKGHRFRSRLEARWAVFFDSMHIEWEYELEGFLLSDGSKYLPDFFSKSLGAWIEIKPGLPDIEEIKKLVRFSIEKEAPLILIDGLPGRETIRIINQKDFLLGSLISKYSARSDENIFELWSEIARIGFVMHPIKEKWDIAFIKHEDYDSYTIEKSINEARGARFEFGESGAKHE